MRRSKSIAAIVGVGGTAVLLMTAAVAQALMDPTSPDPASDELIRTAPAGLTGAAPAASLAANPATAAVTASTDAAALTAAVRAPTPAAATVRWAEAGAASTEAWAQPKLKGVMRFAGQYEPRFDMRLVRKGDGDETQFQLGFSRREQPSAAVSQVSRLSFLTNGAPRQLRQKGHWFLFAAGGGNAVGLNMLRDQSGELRRAGWSAEHIAAVGSGQVGVGWRKGPLQASFGLVQRELSAYGKSVNERFVAFTVSISPTGIRASTPGRAWVERGEDYPNRRR